MAGWNCLGGGTWFNALDFVDNGKELLNFTDESPSSLIPTGGNCDIIFYILQHDQYKPLTIML